MRLIEEELKNDPLLSTVAAFINAYWETPSLGKPPYQEYSLPEVEERWKNTLTYLEAEDFKDGRHCGDCTNVPAPCLRCLVEEYADQAKGLINALRKANVLSTDLREKAQEDT